MNQQPANLNYVVANAYAPSAPEVFQARAPTVNDVNYAVQQRWFNTATDQEYILIGFTSTGGLLQANWKAISTGGNVIDIEVPFGVTPIEPDVTGTITFTSLDSSVTITGSAANPNNNFIDFSASGSAVNAIKNIITDTGAGTPLTGTTINLNSAAPFNTSTGPNAITITATDSTHGFISLQKAGSNNTTSTANNFGIAQFDATQFSVASGFVQLKGATGNPAIQDIDLDNATTPVFAAATGHISLKGGTIQNTGTSATAVQTSGSSSNDAKINLQFAGSNAAVLTANNFGVAQFDANQFNVTGGFVKLAGGGTTPAILNIPVPNGTTPVVPSAAGALSFTSTLGTVNITGGLNTINFDISGGGSPLETLSDDVSASVTPSSNNIQLVGHVVEQGATKFSTVVAGSHLLNINPMSSSRWIVDALGFNGTHTTIASAITSATSGDTIFILPGTYTENLTLKAGVNLTAYDCDAFNNVIISGNCTFTGTGTVNISGIRLQTNSAACLTVSGSNASIINLINCFINCSNSSGITFSSSNASATITTYYCNGDLGTTGIKIFTHTSAGTLQFNYTRFSNTGGSITASTQSAGTMGAANSKFKSPITTSGTATFSPNYTDFNTIDQNVTAVTFGGSGANTCNYCEFSSGSASAISVGSTLEIRLGNISSGNTNTITGAGTVRLEGVQFSGTSSGNNVSTVTGKPFQAGSFFLGNNVQILSDTGDPNGSVTAPQGSIFLRTDGAAATSLYINTNGATTWSAR